MNPLRVTVGSFGFFCGGGRKPPQSRAPFSIASLADPARPTVTTVAMQSRLTLNLNLRRDKVDHVRNPRVVRAGSRYVFPNDVASPATRVRPAESGFSLWSPADAILPKPIERQLPGLFSVGGSDVTIPMRPLQSRGKSTNGPEPLVCCICLEDIEHTPLTCHQCSMSAHPNCLCKWFGTHAQVGEYGTPRIGHRGSHLSRASGLP